MTYKVIFEDNIPTEAVPSKDGTVQKVYRTEGEITVYEWILVDADSEDTALEKAKEVERNQNGKMSK